MTEFLTATGSPEGEFLPLALAALRGGREVQSAAVWEQDVAEGWRELEHQGRHFADPQQFDGVDEEGVWLTKNSYAKLLPNTGQFVRLLAVLTGDSPKTNQVTEELAEFADALGKSWELNRQLNQRTRQVDHFQKLLDLSRQWNRLQETNQLLEQMAEASTDLIEAERATIFLRDESTKTLVGRPALGIESGELRIPESTGVVGQVVQTGEIRKVDRNFQQEQIDRRVDKKTGFQTKTLLCAPLLGTDGKILGAFEMINKKRGNFTESDTQTLIELSALAAQAIENSQEYEQLVRTKDQMAEEAAQGVSLVGNSPAIAALRKDVERVADTELAVLILGENGTGKEVISRLIHHKSKRSREPFVAVNCAAISETLLESELFGHEKGAFTDARETRVGKFELASGGTLFLDEIGDMSLGGQAKLLRVLEEKIVVRVGGSTNIHTDARVLAATNQDLAQLVREKKFREDLFFRLNVVTLKLPALREREDDVLLLAEHFLRDFCLKARRRPPKLAADARKRLTSHAWPGNVRELRNLMERLAYLSSGDTVVAADLDFVNSASPREVDTLDLPLSEATRNFQVHYIHSHIERHRGNMTDAARSLGLHRSNLYRKMKQLEIAGAEDDPDNGM